MNQPKPKWAGLGYEQVPGLANRIIARYLRGQRRNMERFFTERGLLESAERMRQIRLSRQGMLAKNRMLQEVLNEYARGATAQPVAETSNQQNEGSTDVAVSPTSDVGIRVSGGEGADTAGGVPVVAGADGAGFVIEE